MFCGKLDWYNLDYLTILDDADFDDVEATEENESCGVGEIMQWVGVIETARVLECTSCADLIPDCLACDSSINCQMCAKGYLKATITDGFGVSSNLCIEDFCGFYGKGPSCAAGQVTVDGCDKSVYQLTKKKGSVESCYRCSPGYYAE